MVDVERSLHFWLAYTFLALIFLHAIAQRKVLQSLLRRFIGFIKRQQKST
jgi:cytochrome b561